MKLKITNRSADKSDVSISCHNCSASFKLERTQRKLAKRVQSEIHEQFYSEVGLSDSWEYYFDSKMNLFFFFFF